MHVEAPRSICTTYSCGRIERARWGGVLEIAGETHGHTGTSMNVAPRPPTGSGHDIVIVRVEVEALPTRALHSR